MPFAALSEAFGDWEDNSDRSYHVEDIRGKINKTINQQITDGESITPNVECIEPNSFMAGAGGSSMASLGAGSGGNFVLEGFDGTGKPIMSLAGANGVKSADEYKSQNTGNYDLLGDTFGFKSGIAVPKENISRHYTHAPQAMIPKANFSNLGENSYSSPFASDYRLIPKDLEFELEEATRKLTHDNVMDHLRNCPKCRNEISRELDIGMNSANSSPEVLELKKYKGDSSSVGKSIYNGGNGNNIVEVFTFILTGIALILVLNAFVSLGKSLRKFS